MRYFWVSDDVIWLSAGIVSLISAVYFFRRTRGIVRCVFSLMAVAFAVLAVVSVLAHQPTSVTVTEKELWFIDHFKLHSIRLSEIDRMEVVVGCGEGCILKYSFVSGDEVTKVQSSTYTRPRDFVPEMAQVVAERAHLASPTTTKTHVGVVHVWQRP